MIKVLEKHVADKIAAGEVVDRPVSIVKELLENAIDAGADSIVVEIKKGGKNYIRVTDNGCGIPKEEATIAFLRHATSKITEVKDLDSLFTLGFRGEALASIAAVSRVEMITKESDKNVGTKIIIEGGIVVENSSTGCPDGTTIIVRDLFYNTPAREKFMKTDSAESGLITEVVTNLALAYTDIKVRMINNGKILFSTKGKGKRLDVIGTLTGAQQIDSLVPVAMNKPGLEITGYVSGPGESKAGRKSQVYFVNGRVVNSKVMEKGVSKAYSDRLFPGRYPIVYLFLQVDPKIVDVNIHPTKREVRFHNDNEICEFVKEAVVKALSVKEAVPEIKSKDFKRKKIEHHAEEQVEVSEVISQYKKEKETAKKYNDTKINNSEEKQEKEKLVGNETVNDSGNIIEEFSAEKKINENEKYTEQEPDSSNERQDIYTQKEGNEFSFENLQIKGVIFGTYIIATKDDEFYLIDQHAAHERIYFEEILSSMEKHESKSQLMISPITIDGQFPDDLWTMPLAKIGYVIENFGPSTWIVKEIPAFLDEKMAEDLIKEYIDTVEVDNFQDIIEEKDRFHGTAILETVAGKACKAAVKAHDTLAEAEVERLIADLQKCKNPFSCPHGRPTFIKLTKIEIEKRFKRI